MSKERELLERLVKSGVLGGYSFIAEVKALLAQPKQRMTGEEISQGFRADKDASNAESYWAGVALAEKHYGVDIITCTYQEIKILGGLNERIFSK